MLSERTFDTGEVRLSYVEGPDNGPPIILLPGFTGRWQAFQPIIPILLPQWHIYALDYRGHGKSDRTPGHYRAINYLTDCIAFLEGQVAEPAVLLGSSAGGSYVLSMAALHPEYARAAICLDPPFEVETFVAKIDTEEYANMWINEQRLAGRPLEELLSTVPVDRAEELSSLDPEVARYHAEGRLHDFFADYPKFELQRIACPVLLVQGNPTLGAVLSDSEVETAQRQVPRLIHMRLEDKGHEVGLESDAGWVPVMLELLESV